jgi:hypothetical protein
VLVCHGTALYSCILSVMAGAETHHRACLSWHSTVQLHTVCHGMCRNTTPCLSVMAQHCTAAYCLSWQVQKHNTVLVCHGTALYSCILSVMAGAETQHRACLSWHSTVTAAYCLSWHVQKHNTVLVCHGTALYSCILSVMAGAETHHRACLSWHSTVELHTVCHGRCRNTTPCLSVTAQHCRAAYCLSWQVQKHNTVLVCHGTAL